MEEHVFVNAAGYLLSQGVTTMGGIKSGGIRMFLCQLTLAADPGSPDA